MSTTSSGRRSAPGLVHATARDWERIVGLALLWVIPAVAFVLVMVLGGTQPG